MKDKIGASALALSNTDMSIDNYNHLGYIQGTRRVPEGRGFFLIVGQ
ncbi:hypothetical protein SAMN05518801_11244 [Novosphingobium sp. CF614]|nr:hypothetical protein SAMN05518801_11244 [Novosphingobium sp. CF614]